ncbi:recombinase RecT, partial [Escherichia coli]
MFSHPVYLFLREFSLQDFRGGSDASDAQFIALLIVANQYGLNPWTKEIYAFPDKQNGIVPVVGVDGWSRIINENQQ